MDGVQSNSDLSGLFCCLGGHALYVLLPITSVVLLASGTATAAPVEVVHPKVKQLNPGDTVWLLTPVPAGIKYDSKQVFECKCMAT